jgi:hypothetical protein
MISGLATGQYGIDTHDRKIDFGEQIDSEAGITDDTEHHKARMNMVAKPDVISSISEPHTRPSCFRERTRSLFLFLPGRMRPGFSRAYYQRDSAAKNNHLLTFLQPFGDLNEFSVFVPTLTLRSRARFPSTTKARI